MIENPTNSQIAQTYRRCVEFDIAATASKIKELENKEAKIIRGTIGGFISHLKSKNVILPEFIDIGQTTNPNAVEDTETHTIRHFSGTNELFEITKTTTRIMDYPGGQSFQFDVPANEQVEKSRKLDARGWIDFGVTTIKRYEEILLKAEQGQKPQE